MRAGYLRAFLSLALSHIPPIHALGFHQDDPKPNTNPNGFLMDEWCYVSSPSPQKKDSWDLDDFEILEIFNPRTYGWAADDDLSQTVLYGYTTKNGEYTFYKMDFEKNFPFEVWGIFKDDYPVVPFGDSQKISITWLKKDPFSWKGQKLGAPSPALYKKKIPEKDGRSDSEGFRPYLSPEGKITEIVKTFLHNLSDLLE